MDPDSHRFFLPSICRRFASIHANNICRFESIRVVAWLFFNLWRPRCAVGPTLQPLLLRLLLPLLRPRLLARQKPPEPVAVGVPALVRAVLELIIGACAFWMRGVSACIAAV